MAVSGSLMRRWVSSSQRSNGLVGAEKSEIILTARSGRHGLKHRLAEMGFNFTEERFEAIYNAFLSMADKKDEVTSDDLRVLVEAG